MIKISAGRSYKTLHPGDADFTFSPNGITVVSRASIEVSQRCPDNYKDLILECISHGWLRPVAHMRDTEYTMELLQK